MKEKFDEMITRLSPTLRRITYKLNGHFTYFDDDDLFQEALEHLWLASQDGSLNDKTDSYVLQGCYFHLKNYIRKAMDRAKLMSLNTIMDEDDTELENFLVFDDPHFDEAIEKSFIEESPIINSLSVREKEVLNLSLKGMTVREIGRSMGISHVMVVKIKKSIKNKCKELMGGGKTSYQN